MDFFRNRITALLVLLVTSLPALAQTKITVAGLKQLIDGKQNAIAGKSLSTYDLNAAYKARLDSFYLYLGKYAPLTHNHTFAQIPNLQSALNAKVDTSALPRVYFGTGFAGSGIATDKYRLATSGATAGTYGSATKIPVVTIDAYGIVKTVSTVDAPTGGTASNVPTVVSAFTNDAGYQKAADVNTTIAGKAVSAFTNDAKYQNDTQVLATAKAQAQQTARDSTQKLYFIGFTLVSGPSGTTITNPNTGASIVVDPSINQNSMNPVTSAAIYTALLGKQNALVYDSSPTASSGNVMKSGDLFNAFATKAPLTHTHTGDQITNLQTLVNNYTSLFLTALPGYSARSDYSLRGDLTWGLNAASGQTQLTTPTMSGTGVSASQINASWTAVTSASGYTVFIYANAAYTASVGSLTTASGVTTASFTGLSANTPYYLRVKATASGFTDSNYGSVTVSTNALPTLATSTLSSTATGPNTIASSWTAAINATTYVLERAPENTFASPVTVYSGTATSVPGTTTLTAATTYYYRLHSEASGYANSAYAYSNATTQAAAGTNYLSGFTALTITDNQSSSASLSNNAGIYSSTSGSAGGNNANPNQKLTGDGMIAVKWSNTRDVQFGFSDTAPDNYNGGVKAGGYLDASGNFWGVDYTNYTAAIVASASTFTTSDFLFVKRTGTAIAVYKSADGVSFTLLYTNQLAISNTLYAKFILGISPSAVYYPQGYNLTSNQVTPTITSVAISGSAVQGNTLTASYTATGTQGTPKIQWYHSDNATGTNSVTAVNGTASTFVVTNAEINKYVYYVITPTYTDGTSGTAVTSSYTAQVTPNAGASTLLSASVTDATHITLVFDKNTTVSNAGMGLTKNGTVGTPSITGVSGSGTTSIVLTLNSSIVSGNTILFNYNSPWVGSIKSTTGQYGMGAVTGFTVTNNL